MENCKLVISNIYCPGYSGSTILGTLLGCNKNIFFGGEINWLYTNKSYNDLTKHNLNKKLCSNHSNCNYFEELIKTFELKENENSNKIELYLEFIKNKNIKNLVFSTKSLIDHGIPINKYIILFKDPCYLYASHLHYKKFTALIQFCDYYENYYNDIFSFLKDKPKSDIVFVSLENICSNTKNTLINICNTLNIDYRDEMLDLNNYNSHMIAGNCGSRKAKPIKYDCERYNMFVKGKKCEKYILNSNAYKTYLNLKKKEDENSIV